jgi:hypothetical protein
MVMIRMDVHHEDILAIGDMNDTDYLYTMMTSKRNQSSTKVKQLCNIPA